MSFSGFDVFMIVALALSVSWNFHQLRLRYIAGKQIDMAKKMIDDVQKDINDHVSPTAPVQFGARRVK